MKNFNIEEMTEKHGPGLAGTARGPLGRYGEFYNCRDELLMTVGSKKVFHTGTNITNNKNKMCEMALKEQFDFLWIIDDDHVFHPNTLLRLLDCDVPIITPFNLRREAPHNPVINGPRSQGYKALDWECVKGKRGIIEVDNCGGSGMLVRREVLVRMGGDWHREGCNRSNAGGPDLWFFQRAKEMGYKVLTHLGIPMGHIQHVAMWPVLDKNGEWQPEIRPASDLPIEEVEDRGLRIEI